MARRLGPIQLVPLNALDGAVTSNMAILTTSDGSIDAYADGNTNLLLDLSSYFAP